MSRSDETAPAAAPDRPAADAPVAAAPSPLPGAGGLTHLDADGRARMVDVGAKPESTREAVAEALVRMRPQTAALVASGDAPKGDVAAVARVAGIQAAKRTWELIPLCHQVRLASVGVEVEVDPAAGVVRLVGTARATDRTGVEMEALTAASVAALTVYDMVKGVERDVVVDGLRLLRKTGGRHDHDADAGSRASSDAPPTAASEGRP